MLERWNVTLYPLGDFPKSSLLDSESPPGQGASPWCMIFLEVFCRMAETLPPFSTLNGWLPIRRQNFEFWWTEIFRVVFFFQNWKFSPSTSKKTTPNPPPDRSRGFFLNLPPPTRTKTAPEGGRWTVRAVRTVARDLPWQLDLSTTNCFTSSLPGFSLTDGTFTDDGKLGCSCACDTQNPCQVESEIWRICW